MPTTKGCKHLVAEARSRSRSLPVAEAIAKHGDPDVVFVGIRGLRKLERGVMMPWALHARRAMPR